MKDKRQEKAIFPPRMIRLNIRASLCLPKRLFSGCLVFIPEYLIMACFNLYLFIYLSARKCIYLTQLTNPDLSVKLQIYLAKSLSTYLSIDLYINLSSRLSIRVFSFVFLPIHIISLSICLCIYLSLLNTHTHFHFFFIPTAISLFLLRPIVKSFP